MAKSKPTLFWYDFETSGIDPQRDRIFQVAGLRTNFDLEVVSDPVNIFCKPTEDFLPHPQACLVTGITPQLADEKGVSETEFCHQLSKQLMQSETCTIGYNSLSFDDEFTRNLMYRNLRDPYAREWQNGNSRWDLIDVVRSAYTLRPDGIQWPVHEDGNPSFRLEDLSKANNIEHSQAHDALADVYATIAIAKLVRDKQPKLYQYLFSHRSKDSVFKLLSFMDPKPVMYISSFIPASKGCMTMVYPIASHPSNKNSIIVYDLQQDPREFLQLDKQEMKALLFTSKKDLAEGKKRLPIQLIQANKCPVLVPLNTINEETKQRFDIDMQQCLHHATILQAADEFRKLVPELYDQQEYPSSGEVIDPELAIYSGGFFSNDDRVRMNKLHYMTPDQLSQSMHFDDPRIQEMLLRYRARNYPDLLDDNDKRRWTHYCRERLSGADSSGALTFSEFEKAICDQKETNNLTDSQLHILDQLQSWGNSITTGL
ncbi:Exodeoxyribonuclease I [hydrothermal vent metagenome]|uniref:Exodeoxyribonuclease I n=1 Tax=hydrothermal vent metagenome TaxID=652676 RepID=A0A3B0YN06_9ZZZZ